MIPRIKFFNNYQIKLLAITLMTIDHIAYIFNLPEIYRIIGRLAFPLFAFLIYQGFLHSSNVKNYLLRLFLFGVAIEGIVMLGRWFMPLPDLYVNIFLTLAFGLFGLLILDSNLNIILKHVLVLLLAYIARALNFDYSWYGVLYIISFYFFKYTPIIPFLMQLLLNAIVYTVAPPSIQYFSLLSWLFIILYDGKKREKHNFKYAFYLYYPLHLAVLYLIRMLMY